LLLQELLKQLEAAAMAQRMGIPAAAGLDVTADKLAAWQQQLAGLTDAAAAINQQESQLGVKLTYCADLDEAGRVLKEIEEAYAAKAEQ
jgi:DNA repair exonuclease SbcCD ATPase subunit